jgi:putative hydrolase of the HAD superfamily
MSLRAVLFDLDETLIEEESSDSASARAASEVAAQRRRVDCDALFAAIRKRSTELWLSGPMIEYCRNIGISPREGLWGSFDGDAELLSRLRAWIPEYRRQAWSAALRDAGVDDDALAAELAEFFATDRRGRHAVYPESERVLTELSTHYWLALITDGAPGIQREKIRGSKLGRFFGTILVSGEVGFGKPTPEIFTMALERLDAAPHESVMVGDSLPRDIGGARAVGIRTVWVNRRSRSVAANQPKPDLQVPDLRNLPALLEANLSPSRNGT